MRLLSFGIRKAARHHGVATRLFSCERTASSVSKITVPIESAASGRHRSDLSVRSHQRGLGAYLENGACKRQGRHQGQVTGVRGRDGQLGGPRPQPWGSYAYVVYPSDLPPLCWPGSLSLHAQEPLVGAIDPEPCSTAATRSSIRTMQAAYHIVKDLLEAGTGTWQTILDGAVHPAQSERGLRTRWCGEVFHRGAEGEVRNQYRGT